MYVACMLCVIEQVLLQFASPPQGTSCTSPPKDGTAPIPFQLSPNTSSIAPLSPGLYTSSPEGCRPCPTAAEDSFSQAFTSIKTTDESAASSSRLCILETGCSTDTSQLLESKSFIDNMSMSSDVDIADSDPRILFSSCSESNIVNTNATHESTKLTHNERLTSRNDKENYAEVTKRLSNPMLTPDHKLRLLTPTSKERRSKRTRFQSIVRSHSANFERSPISSQHMPGA